MALRGVLIRGGMVDEVDVMQVSEGVVRVAGFFEFKLQTDIAASSVGKSSSAHVSDSSPLLRRIGGIVIWFFAHRI